MAKYSNTIEYNISTKLDSSGLIKLQAQLKQLENSMQQMANKKLLNPGEVAEARDQLSKLGEALGKSYDPSLGVLNFSKLRSEINATGISADKLQTAFRLGGAEGATALSNTAKQLLNFNSGIERTSSALDKMFVTFQNTFRWGVISSFFSQFMNAIHSSVEYTKELDDSLTQIMLVTDYSRDSMNEYAKAANEAAKAVGQTTVGMTNASLIFAQQGYDLDQSQQLATLSAKLANASQQDTATTSDQITAYMNAYGLSSSIEDLSSALDSWALVANVSAADVAELATASQKAASTANSVGVNMDQLNAQIATIESVTRDAPEQIGNGLKTLYARFSDIKLGKTLEDGVDLGQVTGQLNKLGVQVLDQFGNIRDVGDILEDLMVIWNDLDQTTKEASAQTLAGKFQMNRFLALMDNSDMYREYLGASENAEGTLDQMNEEYLDSLQGRMATLQSTLEGLFNDVFTTDMVYPLIDTLTKMAEAIDTLFKSVGGGPTIILGLATAFTQLFSQNIARGINNTISNAQVTATRKQNVAELKATAEESGISDSIYGEKFAQIGELASQGVFNNQDDYETLKQKAIEYIDATAEVEKVNEEVKQSFLSLSAVLGKLTNDPDNNIWKDLDANEFNIEDALTNIQALKDEDFARLQSIDWPETKKNVTDFAEAIGNVQHNITVLSKTTNDNDIDIFTNKSLNSLEIAYDKLEMLREEGLIGSDTYREYQRVLDQAFEELDDGTLDKATKDVEELSGEVSKLAENINNINPNKLTKEGLIQDINNLAGNQSNKQSGLQQFQNMKEQELDAYLALQRQQLDVKGTIEFAGGLQQIAFGIQSIQNLGNIWSDENLSTTEKLTQYLLNLGMAIPALLNGLEKLKNIDKVIKTLGAAENYLMAQSAKASAANTGFALSNFFVAKSSIVASKAISLLQRGLTNLTTVPVISALTAIGIALAIVSNEAKKAEEALQISLDSYNGNYEKTQIDTSNFDKLYEEYKKTGVASDELTQAGKDLAQQLGIVGGGALAASGNFTQLAIEIEKAKNIANDMTDISAENAIRGLSDAANTHYLFDTDDFLYTASYASDVLSFVDQFGNSIGDLSLPEKIAEVDEAIANEQQHYNELVQQQNELENSNLWQIDPAKAAADQASLNREIEKSGELLNNLGAITQTDEYTQGRQIIEQQAERQISNLSEDEFKDMSYDEIITALTDVSGDYQWIAQQYQLICAQLGEDAGRAYLEGLMRESNLDTWAEGQWATLQNLIQNNPIESVTEYGPGDYHEVHRGEPGLENLQQFGETNNLSTSSLIKISEIIDWTDPDIDQHMGELLASLQEDLNSGLSIDEAIFNQGIQQGTISDEEILKQKRDDIGYVGEDWDRDTEGVKDYADSLQELADISDDIADSLEEDRETALRIADANARLNKGVKSLADSWDDWNKIISDTSEGIEATEDYSDAIQGIEDALTNIFDFDVSTGLADSTQFIKDHMDDIAAAAEGDMDAIERLRIAAAQQILIDADFDWTKLNVSQDELFGLISELNNEEIEVGATLDTTTFGEALAIALQAVGATTEEMQKVFDSLGWEPNITYETYKVADNSRQTTDGTIEIVDPEAPGGTRTVKVSDEVVFNGDNTVTIPKINAKGTTYQGSAPKITSPSSHSSSGGGRGGGGKGGKGKGGKGGGGGKAKTIEPKEKKEHEKDYYEEVNSQLDKTEKILSRIEKEEDRLIGDKARANQNKQLTLLQKEIKLNEEKLEINKQELKDTDERLKQQDKLAEQILKQQGLSMLIPEPVLDEDGVIANYEQISKALDDAHNKLIDKYNAAAKAGNEELTKEIEKQIGKFDDYSKNLLDAAKRHDTLQSEIEETTNALEDLKDAIEDIQIAAYNAALDAAEEWQDLMDKGAELQGFFREFDPDSYLRSFSIDERPYEKIIEDLYTLQNEYAVAGDQANQFYNDIIAQKRKELEETNDLYEQQAILDAIQYFEDEQSRITEDFLENGVIGYWSRRLEELQQWMDNPNDASNPFGENTAELVETYKRVWEQAAEETENFREKVQDLRDDIIDAVEEFDDDLDRQYDKFEDLIDELEQIGDTYTLYYGDDSYTELTNILQKEGEVLQSELDRRQQEYEKWVELYQQALETGDKKTIQAIEDLMNDARKEMRDSAEQLAEVWVKQFETSINRSTQQMTQNVWGRNDLEELSDNWELEKQYIEDYKDEVEKAYEIDKLRSKYIDLLNDAQGASLATQNKIRQEMQDQLNYLENQATVSEYDVKLANAKLEILQKQIALEDAQRNKNRMQLRRDTQGNYRYVYRADDDDIKQAQDELLESSYDIYEITKDQTITNNDRMISTFLDFQEKAKNIAEKYKDDEVARQAALNDLAEQYKKIWTALGEDFGDVTNGMYDVLWWNINNLIGNSADASLEKMNQLYDENGNIKEKTGEQWRDLATEIQNDVIDKVYDSAIDCITDINVSGQKLANNIAGSLDVIGAGVDSLDISLAEATDATRNLKEATDDLFAAFNGDNAQINNAMKMISDYRAELEKTQNSASNLANQLTEANKKIANLTAENTAYKTSINNSPSKRTGSSGSSSGGGSSSSGGSGSSGGNSSSGGNRSSGGSSSSGGSKGKSANSIANSITKKNSYQWQNHTSGTSSALGGKRLLMYYDSGGYTGEWGSDGRLAVLHQKELVLNAEDTENILGAVAMMRGMVSAIQTGALSRSISSSINNANKNFGDTIEQRVEISATFPAVTNSNEIEAALLGLSDKAYQYSYRTR